jgi:hypothetical protein
VWIGNVHFGDDHPWLVFDAASAGLGLRTGAPAVGSSLSFGLYGGGCCQNQPGLGGARSLANIGREALLQAATLGAGNIVRAARGAGGALRLVVGGGRIARYPAIPAGSIALNTERLVNPHVVGDIAAAPFRCGVFREILFEKVPFDAFTGENIRALGEAAWILRGSGRLIIETGSAAPVDEIVSELTRLGFRNVRAQRVSGFLRFTATLGRSR